MEKANFITQLILEIKLTHYSSSLCACPSMPDHTHLKQPTNICSFHGFLVTSRNSTSYLNLFLRYSSLKNPASWLALRLFNYNARTRFFPNILFLWNVKRSLTLSCWNRNACIYISMDKIFAKILKTSVLGLSQLSKPIWTFLQKLGSVTFLLNNA